MSDNDRRVIDILNEHFPFVVEGIAILIVGIVGVAINTVALGILFRKRVIKSLILIVDFKKLEVQPLRKNFAA